MFRIYTIINFTGTVSLCVLGFGKWFSVCIHVSTVRLQEVLWMHHLKWTWSFVNCIMYVSYLPNIQTQSHPGFDWVGFGWDYFGASFEVAFLPLTWHPHGLLGDLLRWRRRVSSCHVDGRMHHSKCLVLTARITAIGTLLRKVRGLQYISIHWKCMTTCFSKTVTWLKIVQSCGFVDILSHLLRLVTCDTKQAKCSRMGN